MASSSVRSSKLSNVSKEDEEEKASTKKRVLNLANELLAICHNEASNNNNNNSKTSLSQNIPRSVSSIDQLKSNVYVFIYETLCNTELVDKKWPAKCLEDEVHNVQAVIDSLSMDILHEDLSHLTGEGICGGVYAKKRASATRLSLREESAAYFEPDLVSVEYLLDIMRCIHDWVSSRLESATESSVATNPASFVQDELTSSGKKQTDSSKHNSPSKQVNNVKLSSNSRVVEDEEDIFKNYMKQKEKEFRTQQYHRPQQQQQQKVVKKSMKEEWAPKERAVSKSSSGNSSLSSSIRSDLDDREAIDLNNNKPKNPTIKRSQIRSSQINNNEIGREDLNTLIQTVNNELKSIRLNLESNRESEQGKIRNLLSTVYSEDLKDAKSIMTQSLNKIRTQTKITDELFRDAYGRNDLDGVRRSARSTSRSTKPKSLLLPNCKKIGANFHSAVAKKRSQSVSNQASPRLKNTDFVSRFTIGSDGILSSLLQEFPYLYSSPETIHYLWEKHSKQIEKFSQMQKEIESKFVKRGLRRSLDDCETASSNSFKASSSKAEQHLKETYEKQQMLMEIMRKDLMHIQRMEDLKRKQEVENSLKARMREQRFQNAKIKRYYEEFRLQQRAKMLKKATSEELVFKDLFNEALKIQKERILELRKYAKEKSEISEREQLNQIASIENFYKNKFDLLNEKMRSEKEANQVRNKAQHLCLGKMKNQVKEKLESDIRDLQEQMCRDKDFLHWREADAKKLISELRSANYFKPKN